MGAEQLDQDRRDGDGAGLVVGAVLQAAFLAGGAGLADSVSGLVLAAIIGRAAFGSFSFGATGGTAAGWATAAAAAGLLIAAAAVLTPAWPDQRAITVAAARRTVGRPRQVWWMRCGVDFWLLIGAAAVFWLTARSGYQLVLVPEGLPTLSVSYWAFAGPALFWAGTALLFWRLADLLLSRGRPLYSPGSPGRCRAACPARSRPACHGSGG